MSIVLEQAQQAAHQENWALLNQCLQQLLQAERLAQVAAADAAQLQATTSDADTAEVLALALHVLEMGDFQARWDVAKMFPSFGTEAIAPLLNLLQDKEADWELRWFAVRILGEFNHPDSIAALVNVLQAAESEDLSTMAAESLAGLGSAAIDVLTPLLATSEWRQLAVYALSRIRNTQIIEPLLKVIDDPQAQVRAATIEALSSFHDSRIPPVLVMGLTDRAAAVRREAVIGLGLRADLQQELGLVERLRPCLNDLDLDVCRQTATALGRIGTLEAATALYHLLIASHPPLLLRLHAIRTLGWIDHPTVLEYLQQCFQPDMPVEVWETAIVALSQVEVEPLRSAAATILLDLLSSELETAQHPQIQQMVALGLAQLGDMRALEALIALLAKDDMGLKLHAIAALKKLHPEQAHSRLQQLSQQADLEPQLRQGIILALQEWSGELA